MKWFVEAIMKQLNVDEAAARVVFTEISQNFEGYFSELTKAQVKRLIADNAYVLSACGVEGMSSWGNLRVPAKCTTKAGHDGQHYDKNLDVAFSVAA